MSCTSLSDAWMQAVATLFCVLLHMPLQTCPSQMTSWASPTLHHSSQPSCRGTDQRSTSWLSSWELVLVQPHNTKRMELATRQYLCIEVCCGSKGLRVNGEGERSAAQQTALATTAHCLRKHVWMFRESPPCDRVICVIKGK